MKREVIIIMLLAFSCMISNAQTWAEWFKQKKTQKKYLLEQIAAYQVYLEYAKKGYTIAKDGTKLIGDIKNGDFDLHHQYFNSLKAVNPQIRDGSQTNDIISMYNIILKSQAATIKIVESSKVFTAKEVLAIKELHASLVKDAEHCLQDLKLLTEDGKLELSDDERILRLEILYKEMKRKYGFQLHTDAKISALAESRTAERKELEVLKKLYGF